MELTIKSYPHRGLTQEHVKTERIIDRTESTAGLYTSLTARGGHSRHDRRAKVLSTAATSSIARDAYSNDYNDARCEF